MSPPAPAAVGSAFSNSAGQIPRSTNDGVDQSNNDNGDNHYAAAAAAAATLTPYTAARASFDTGAARRQGSSPRRNYTVDGLVEMEEREQGSRNGGAGATSATDVENPPQNPVAKDRLMEDVPAESRIILEFRDLSCFVPRLFPASSGGGGGFGGAGAGGALMRSATVLGRSVTRQRRQPAAAAGNSGVGNESVVAGSTIKAGGVGSSIAAPSSSSSKPMRQVSRGGQEERKEQKKLLKKGKKNSTS